MSWQRKILSTGALVGVPGPLPAELVGLAPETLANLPAGLPSATVAQLGYQDTGFVQVADVQAPTPLVRWITPYQFLQRFTQPERVAIEGSADGAVKDFLFELGKLPVDQPSLNLDDPQVIGGIGYLASAGVALLGAGRPAQILA